MTHARPRRGFALSVIGPGENVTAPSNGSAPSRAISRGRGPKVGGREYLCRAYQGPGPESEGTDRDEGSLAQRGHGI
jgi:hypothetical protein